MEAGKKRLAGDTARQAMSPEVKDLRREASDLKEDVADLTLENRLLKKSMLGDRPIGDRGTNEISRLYKLEIIRLVEHSQLSVRHTLDKIGVSRWTFYRWCDLYQRFGEEVLEDKRVGPPRAWNRIPDCIPSAIMRLSEVFF